MESGRITPLVFTFVAALAVLYPVTTANRAPATDPATATSLSAREPESSEDNPAKAGFPTAKDLVADFLFQRQAEQVTPAGQPTDSAYSIDLMIATVPDPVSSRLPRFFDCFIESMESAAEASGYTLDRFALPWLEKATEPGEYIPSWRQTLYGSVPGLILFRDPQHQKLLLIFLVGETPTTGIHKPAMFAALEQMAQFYPWDSKHADLPAGFPLTSDSEAVSTFRVMGPSFSGSAVSLRFVLDKWSESRGNPSNVRFQILSGTATAIDAKWLSQAAHGHTTFQAAVPPDNETLQAVACYIELRGYPKIAILTEGNTAYGQNFTNQSAAGKAAAAEDRGSCGNGHAAPEILSLPFPMHISRLRAAVSKATPQSGQPGAATANSQPISTQFSHESSGEAREDLPAFSELTVQSAELTLSNLLSTIAREQYGYVGIVATDVRDVTFLAHEVQQHCAATVLFTLNSDLLYADADVNGATRGMIITTPYPLFNLEQLWTYAYGGGKSRLQFSNQAAEGVYNAALALFHQDGKMVDYGRPLAVADDVQPAEPHKPSLWVTAIGNGETLPVELLEWKDGSNYTYSPARMAAAKKSSSLPSVGRGIYVENSVVAFIVLTIVFAVVSLLMVSQYRRPESGGASSVFAFFGDTVSPAYWSECRLFLLCGCVSLLAYYVIVATAFVLPFMTARALGGGINTTLTPRIAAYLSIIAILLLLWATYTLLSAFRKAPSNQRGSAPEVIFFALFSCAFVFSLSVFLGVSWLENVQVYPASGLFNHLRSFDFGGGLSPLLPLTCVAAGACLWAVCSFRRLRLLDVLRATGTSERPNLSLRFLCLDIRSFSGICELESSVKQILESSSVISLRWYSILLALALLVGHYFFATRVVRGFEPRPFYWLFEAAFIIVYWALMTEFLRLIFAWRSLHLLLQRLSWHPLLGAFKRYRGGRPNLAKMNLTHPPSSFAALESSVDQAARLVRTARTLAQGPGSDEGLRGVCHKSLPEWQAQVQGAGGQLYEALRLEWSDDSQVGSPTRVETGRKKRASRLHDNWRQSLKARCHAHHALFRLSQSLGKVMDAQWSCAQTESDAAASIPGAKDFFDQVEEFIVSRAVNFLAIVFPSLQNLAAFVLAGLLLMLLAVTSYPFQPRNEFLFFNWVVILAFMGTVFWIFIQMDRDTVLSLLSDTVPGQINFSRELALRMVLYVAVPIMALLGAQFPESLRQILSLFTAGQATP